MEWKISIVSPIYYNPIAILNLTYEEMLGGGGEDLMEPTCVRRRQRGSITLAKQPDWTKPLPLPVFPMIFISRNKTIFMSCGGGNKTLDMMIKSWISWTNNQRWRLLVMIRSWWRFRGGRGIDWCRLLFGMVAHFPSCHHCHPHQSNSLPAFVITPNNTFHPFLRHFNTFFLVYA